jgi:hypothetical protein
MTTTFTLIKPEDLIVEFDGGSVLIRLRATNEFIRSMTREEAAALRRTQQTSDGTRRSKFRHKLRLLIPNDETHSKLFQLG